MPGDTLLPPPLLKIGEREREREGGGGGREGGREGGRVREREGGGGGEVPNLVKCDAMYILRL